MSSEPSVDETRVSQLEHENAILRSELRGVTKALSVASGLLMKARAGRDTEYTRSARTTPSPE